MKLTIKNETKWSQRDLRRFIAAGIKAEGVEGKGHWRVRVCHTRSAGGSSGYAYYNSTSMTLRVTNPNGKTWMDHKPRAWTTLPDHELRDLAHVLVHEIAHCRGLRHGDMHGGHDGYCHGNQRGAPLPAWATGLTIGLAAAAKPRPRPDKEGKARSALAEWERRMKYAANKVRKYRQKVRYYERRAAASPPPSTASGVASS